MADVVTALGRACQEAGHDVKVILPKYDVIDYNAVSLQRTISALLQYTQTTETCLHPNMLSHHGVLPKESNTC